MRHRLHYADRPAALRCRQRLNVRPGGRRGEGDGEELEDLVGGPPSATQQEVGNDASD
jgi:hypothetical protein